MTFFCFSAIARCNLVGLGRGTIYPPESCEASFGGPLPPAPERSSVRDCDLLLKILLRQLANQIFGQVGNIPTAPRTEILIIILNELGFLFGWLEGVELPLPIPNRVVKRSTADDTRKGESRQPPIQSTKLKISSTETESPACKRYVLALRAGKTR